MASSAEAGGKRDLVRYMDMLSDVRRAAVIVCDSIRVREESICGLRRFQASGNPEEAPRCPVCILEYKDPTVVISVCGHGMHKECAETLIEKNNNGNAETQRFLCPLCRAAFRKENVITLVSVIPSDTDAAAWRTVQLAGLWKEGMEQTASGDQTNKHFRHITEQLYGYIRRMFRNTNDLTCAIGGALQRFEEAIEKQEEVRNNSEEERVRIRSLETRLNGRLNTRNAALNERERRLLAREYQNAAFITQCLRAVRREEGKEVQALESMRKMQQRVDKLTEELNQTRDHLKMTQRVLEIERNLRLTAVQPGNNGTNNGQASPPIAVVLPELDLTAQGVNLQSVFPPADRVVGSVEVIGIEESDCAENAAQAAAVAEGSPSSRRGSQPRRRETKRLRRNYRLE